MNDNISITINGKKQIMKTIEIEGVKWYGGTAVGNA